MSSRSQAQKLDIIRKTNTRISNLEQEIVADRKNLIHPSIIRSKQNMIHLLLQDNIMIRQNFEDGK